MIEWFEAKKLVLYLEKKTNIMKFLTVNSLLYALTIGYKNKYIKETLHTKFLGLQLDSHLK